MSETLSADDLDHGLWQYISIGQQDHTERMELPDGYLYRNSTVTRNQGYVKWFTNTVFVADTTKTPITDLLRWQPVGLKPNDYTERLPIPGGYLYRNASITRNAAGYIDWNMNMAYVPDDVSGGGGGSGGGGLPTTGGTMTGPILMTAGVNNGVQYGDANTGIYRLGPNLNFKAGNVVGFNLTPTQMAVSLPISLGNTPITGLANPTTEQDAATKFYVDETASKFGGAFWFANIGGPVVVDGNFNPIPVISGGMTGNQNLAARVGDELVLSVDCLVVIKVWAQFANGGTGVTEVLSIKLDETAYAGAVNMRGTTQLLGDQTVMLAAYDGWLSAGAKISPVIQATAANVIQPNSYVTCILTAV